MLNITPEQALTEYGIFDIDDQIEKACFAAISRILENPDSSLTKKLTSTARTCFSSKFRIPKFQHEKFKKNSVNKFLRKLRDTVSDLYTTDNKTVRIRRQRKSAAPPAQSETVPPKPLKTCRFCHKADWLVPGRHEYRCESNPNSEKGKKRQFLQQTLQPPPI